MPIIKSAIKRARQSVSRRSRNLQVKRAVKADITAVETAVTAGNAAEATVALTAAYSEIDRAVKKGTLHKNTAARRKSQLATSIAKLGSDVAVEAPKTTKGAGKAATKTTAKKPAAAKKPVEKKTPAKPVPSKVEGKAPATKE